MSDTPQDGPGAELKTTREGMEVSTREVADALNLPVHVIEALEADDYEGLPPTVFTRGYLRSYARLLELSPESLLARYPEVTEETDAITGELSVTDAPAGAPTRTLGVAAVVGIVLIALLVWLLGDEESATPIVESTVTEAEADAQPEAVPAQEPIDSPTEDVVSQQPADLPVEQEPQAVTPAVTDFQTSERLDGEQSLPEPGSSAVELQQAAELPAPAEREASEPPATDPDPAAPAAPSYQERRITEFGDDEITFVFSEDCWLEVKSAEGENLYSDLNRTGRTLVLTGRAPFRILLGYAPGVSLSFNGEPVPLERYSRNNVANLVLGE